MIKYFFMAFIISSTAMAKDYGRDQIKKLSWGGVDVLWLKDDRFPTYSISVYFADGALGDGSVKGSTSAALGLIKSGTRRYGQKEISDTLDFFAAGVDTNVNHEYSRLEISGLVKDIVPTMKKVCHLMQDSVYPKTEIKKELDSLHASMANIETDHRSLADLVFREVSLEGVPFSYPVTGRMKDHRGLNSDVLRKRLEQLNSEVKKRIYITGPSEILNIDKIINEECGWNDKATFVRNVDYKSQKTTKGPSIFLVPVKKANQAQVRIGRFLNKDELIPGDERHALLGEFLAGGFTSVLMDELRTKRGLVYGVGAFSAAQRDYGRAVITTATRAEKVVDLINVVKESLHKLSMKEVDEQRFELAKSGLAGSYPFRFEESEHYLFQLLFLDHLGLSYDELYKSADKIRSYKLDDLSQLAKQVFEWDNLTILVLGEASLKKELEKLGKVTVLNYKDYL